MKTEYGPIIDWWFIPHVALPIWIASTIHAKWEPVWWIHLICWAGYSFGWEGAEHFLQRAYLETWVVIEHPINAWVMDPLANGIGWVIGALIGRWSKARKWK